MPTSSRIVSPRLFFLLLLMMIQGVFSASVSGAVKADSRSRQNALLHGMATEYVLSLRKKNLDESSFKVLAEDEAGLEAQRTNSIARDLARDHVAAYRSDFLKGRYDRSLARAPENLDAWRQEPDISNPGADLANFPNSAFTLPEGRSYIEFSPASWYGAAPKTAPQYNTQFLLRYGLTDDFELRIFGNGVTWKGGKKENDGFSPIAFDTKIHLLDENLDLGLPALGFEAYVQTDLLATQGFQQSTTGGFSFNFDQSLPYEIDAEYNFGSAEIVKQSGEKTWQFNFQWALQHDILDGDAAVFMHGFYNDMTLPRLPRQRVDTVDLLHRRSSNHEIAAVGGGALWTINTRWVVWAQASGGVTRSSPSVITDIGFAVAF